MPFLRKLDKNFILILIGNTVSRIGSVAFTVSLTWWIIDSTGSAANVGYILASTMIPIALFGFLSGVLTDRWNKKYILIATDVVSGSVTIAVGVMASFKIINIPMLVVINFILGCCSCLFKPTFKSIIPEIVKKDSLVMVNSITTSAAEATKVIGPVMGVALINIPSFGIAGAFFINGLSFVLSGVCSLFLDYRMTETKKVQSEMWNNFKDGIKYVLAKTVIRNVFILASMANIFFASFDVLMPLYIKNIMFQTGKYYSFVLAIYSAGGISVILLSLILRNIKTTQNILTISIALSGIVLILIPFSVNYIGLAMCVYFYGLLIGIFNTLLFAYIQNVVDTEYMGRTFSLMYMVAFCITPAACVAFGYLGDYLLKYIFLYSGIGVLLCCIPFIKMERAVEVDSII